ncbi:cupin domain-containing protein [Cupriavidus basilensis]|uniref:Cupin domain-containing protein n=1 Tax=Cupriavidus basilensis TaxID=68895 RepID=A0ABT6B2Z0_9BURK|nr:cupin domain-containing protein [Cupriavidus basilensis]MDF3839163.1 cupin domain-containing protein [Cupriavidus basilensis]
MPEATKWRGGVTVVRGRELELVMRDPSGTGRATALDFVGTGGQKTWIGTVTVKPGTSTGMHHHGRHEVAIYVLRGRSEIRWGDRLEFAAEVADGDCVYFAPNVPHQELNLSNIEAVDFLVVRSDNEKIAIKLDGGVPVERPEMVF